MKGGKKNDRVREEGWKEDSERTEEGSDTDTCSEAKTGEKNCVLVG